MSQVSHVQSPKTAQPGGTASRDDPFSRALADHDKTIRSYLNARVVGPHATPGATAARVLHANGRAALG